jgi:putative transcriptional regulator
MGKDHQKLLNNLEELRKLAGLTQEELSVKAEVSRKSINAIENGVYVPSTVLALKISKTLKCQVEDLLPALSRLFVFTKQLKEMRD